MSSLLGAKVEVVKRQSQTFEVLPRRWVVERTFAWLYEQRRLVSNSVLKIIAMARQEAGSRREEGFSLIYFSLHSSFFLRRPT
jgi:transposase